MLVEAVERKLGAVKGPDGFESSARTILPINVGCNATQCSPRLPGYLEIQTMMACLHTADPGLIDMTPYCACILCKSTNTNEDDQCVRGRTGRRVLLLLNSGEDLTLSDLSRNYITTFYTVKRSSITSFKNPFDEGNSFFNFIETVNRSLLESQPITTPSILKAKNVRISDFPIRLPSLLSAVVRLATRNVY